jgi:NADH-quinone oxidoreductase subunit G
MEMANELAAILKAVNDQAGDKSVAGQILKNITVNDRHRAMAGKLMSGQKSAVLVGNGFISHPHYSVLRYLAGKIAELTGSTFGYLGDAANETGCWLAGAVPHRGVAGEALARAGLDALRMMEKGLQSYVLFNLDPLIDSWDGDLARQGLEKAGTVIALSSYRTPSLEQYADILLPVSIYAENEGSYFNVEGTQQVFSACVSAQGESRPGWKVLRVLANHLGLDGYEYETAESVRNELSGKTGNIAPAGTGNFRIPESVPRSNGAVIRMTDQPMNSSDLLVRHAAALQQTTDVADGLVHMNGSLAERLGLSAGVKIRLQQRDNAVELGVLIDSRVPDNTVLTHAGHPVVSTLGPWFGEVTFGKI